MSRTILSLILAFGLFACMSAAVSGAPDAYANDFIKKFAGKYYNSTNTTAAAEDKNATADAEAATPNPACEQTLNKTNDAVAQFAESVGTAKDKWSLLGSISRLSGQSYSLGFSCNPENLKLVNSGEVGVNKTQDEACDKLIEIIQPLLIKSKDDKAAATGGFEQSLASSQKALAISKKLGDKCKVTLIDITQPEEEEVEVEEEIEEEEEATLEESINEEELEEEEESYDLIVQVVDEEGNLETIYYGFPDVDIDLTADENVEQEIEEEESAEVEEEEESAEASLISFVQTKAPQNKPNPNPWSSVDYKGKYSSGGAGGDYSTGAGGDYSSGAGGNYTVLSAF